MAFKIYETEMTERVKKLMDATYGGKPTLESDRAVLITESYKQTENLPIEMRRALALKHILENLPIAIRDNELIVGCNTKAPRSSQVFPEFSFEWIEQELDTMEHRAADPFVVSEEDKKILRSVFPYWKGRTVSDLALSYMTDETKK
ncbi:MAG: glycyl radical protein, partial [Clostridia bacterium]|nr:glycyl radical protein [Clostridia bacterium]